MGLGLGLGLGFGVRMRVIARATCALRPLPVPHLWMWNMCAPRARAGLCAVRDGDEAELGRAADKLSGRARGRRALPPKGVGVRPLESRCTPPAQIVHRSS